MADESKVVEQAETEETVEVKKPVTGKTNAVPSAKSQKKQKPKKEKGRLKRKLKETGSELKKVTWPSFKNVAKKTGIVLAMVAIFTIVLFGFDKLMELLFKLLVK